MRSAPESAELPDVLAFMQGLWAVSHRLERLSKQMRSRSGITGPQRLVLRLIDLFPGISAGDLATLLHLHPSTLTGILRRLEDQQLVARASAPDDRRRTVLRLTPLGAATSHDPAGTLESAVAATFERSTPDQRTATRKFLEELAAVLDDELEASRT